MTMTVERWGDLPEAVRETVFRYTEGLISAEPVAAGSAEITLVLSTLSSGRLFMKGVRGERAQIELRVQPFLPGCAPRLRWHAMAGGYVLLAFQHVEGRHAKLEPGSPDLPAIANALSELSRTERAKLPVLPAEKRWAQFCHDQELLQLISGDTLIHTDLTAGNILIGEQVQIVDWAWPSRGAPWLDTAAMVARLIQAGHSPEQAEDWARGVPAWRAAPRFAVAGYAELRAAVARARQDNILDAWERYLAWLTVRAAL